jgi:hypothetical protein
LALLADVDFVLEDEFQEVGVGQVVALGFLEAHVEALVLPVTIITGDFFKIISEDEG